MGNSRTITLSAYQLNGVSPLVYAPLPLAWSPKRASETAVFKIDFAANLDDGDAIVAASVTIVPDIPGGLIIVSRAAVGTVVLAALAGGVAGQAYDVTMSGATVNQSLHPATVELQVVA